MNQCQFPFQHILWMDTVCSSCCFCMSGGKMKCSCFWIHKRPYSSFCQISIMLSNVYTTIQRRQCITLANATQFPPRINPTWLAISVSVLPWLEWNGRLRGRHRLLVPNSLFSFSQKRKIYSRNLLQIQQQSVSVCVWLGRGLSVSSATPPGPSWAAANLSRRQGRGQASAKTFMKPSTAPRRTSGLWTWLIGESICTFGAIIAERWSVLRVCKKIRW